MMRHPMRPFRSILLALALLLVWGSAPSGAQDPSEADALVARAGAYVRARVQQFTSMVGEEHQHQRLVRASGRTRKERILVSDVLVVSPEGRRPVVLRDVASVDGKPVRNRDERLRRLFAGNPRTAFQQAQAIVAEGARYDLDFPRFTFLSGVVLPLVLVVSETGRYQFSRTEDGVSLRETRSPTLFRLFPRAGPPRDIPLSGRLGVDATTGALRSASIAAASVDLEAAIDVRYAEDGTSGMFVPVEMHETYRRPARPTDDYLEVSTDYTNFRRFTVTVDEQTRPR
jgi:hypothetical protein